MTEILTIAIAYLLGSILFAYIVARLIEGVDIRQLGDHNPGTANVIREVGPIPGLIVLALDAGKGVLAISIAEWLGASQIIVLICGIAVVTGHMWPIFFGFKGGGGAATTLGVFFALLPLVFSINFVLMAITFILTRNFSFSFAVGVLPLPLILWASGADTSLVIYSIALPLFLTLRKPGELLDIIRKLTTGGNWKEVVIDRRFRLPKRNKGFGKRKDTHKG